MHRACPVCEASNQSMVSVKVVVLVMDEVTESAPVKVMVYVPLGGLGTVVLLELLPHAVIARPAEASTMIHATERNLRA